MSFTSFKEQKGFTLIELLVVIAIVGLLSSIVIASTNSARRKARLVAAKKFDAALFNAIGADIVADWSFSECSGSVAADGAASAAATLSGATAWSADTPYGRGCALAMSGSDYASSPENDARDIRVGSMTWSLWAKTSSTSRQIFYRKSDGSNTNGIMLELLAGGTPRCIIHNPAVQVISTVILSDGDWHHLSCSLDRSAQELRLYVDGTLTGSADAAALAAIDLNGAFPSYIGYPSQGPIGLVSAVRIYAAAYPGN